MSDKIKSNLNDSLKFIKNSTISLYEKFFSSFNYLGKKIAKTGVSANFVTIVGFLIGLSAINFLALENYGYALICIILNRLFDALDGAIARHSKVTDFGVFLDATLDYIFYAGVIFGFALANPLTNAPAAMFLAFAFCASATTLLAYAVVAMKNGVEKKLDFSKSPFYLGGFAQGSETLVALIVLCVMPAWFVQIALILGVLCFIKAFSTIATAYYSFVIAQPKKNK